jgi:hypothetical protein
MLERVPNDLIEGDVKEIEWYLLNEDVQTPDVIQKTPGKTRSERRSFLVLR